jgi:hypothetical protein
MSDSTNRIAASFGVVLALVPAAVMLWLTARAAETTTPHAVPDRRPFILGRSEDDDPLRVTRQTPIDLPMVYGDVRLTCTVEMSPDTELDLLARHVRPVLRGTADMPLFHGRFVGARMTARSRVGREEPIVAMRSREDLLFGIADESAIGVPLAPGFPATVTIETRGRTVRAEIAGRGPWEIEAQDEVGAFAFVLHERRADPDPAWRPSAIVRDLRIEPLGDATSRSPLWRLPTLVVLGAAVLLGFACRSRGEGLVSALARGVLVTACLAGGVFVGGAFLRAALLPELGPTPLGFALAIGAGLVPTALIVGTPGSWGGDLVRGRRLLRGAGRVLGLVVVATVGVFVMLEASARQNRHALRVLEDPRVDAWFGFDSGAATFDALAGRVATRRGIVGPELQEPRARRVVFLGGGGIFESAPDRAFDLGAFAVHRANERREAVGFEHPLEAFVVPTLYGNAAQQVRMLERFYLEVLPDLVVLAVPAGDAIPVDEPRPAYETTEASRPPTPQSLVLEVLRHLGREPVPALDEASLQRTLDRLDELASRSGGDVLLLDQPGLPSSWRNALRARAEVEGWGYAEGVLDAEPTTAADRLADAMLRVLVR